MAMWRKTDRETNRGKNQTGKGKSLIGETNRETDRGGKNRGNDTEKKPREWYGKETKRMKGKTNRDNNREKKLRDW